MTETRNLNAFLLKSKRESDAYFENYVRIVNLANFIILYTCIFYIHSCQHDKRRETVSSTYCFIFTSIQYYKSFEKFIKGISIINKLLK